MAHRPILALLIAAILLLLIFGTGIGVGYGVARVQRASSIETIFAQRAGSYEELNPEFEIFWEAMDLLYRDFFGQLPDDEEATHGAIRGVINLLDDPNTSFLTPGEAELFRTNIQGSFEGIGARVAWDSDANTVRVVEPFENQPAWNAGVRRDDLILEVDGDSVVGTDLNDAVTRIRGPKGSVVVLLIMREDRSAPFEIEVVRDRIETPTISVDSVGDAGQYAYVRLNTFNENSGELVREAIEDAMDAQPAGLIFDLRGNTGGLLREAVRVASVFLEDQIVLIERFSDGNEEIYRTEGASLVEALPLVVLVNGGSASASEIVAGAIQDAERGVLIGTTTFGKGSVQLPHTLSNGGIMRVTIARWFTPNDRSIDGTGLEPDVEVEITEEQYEAEEDPQLDAAIDYLDGL